MMIHTPEDIDFSTFPASDGQPMAETYPNVLQMLDLLATLQTLFELQGRAGSTTVGANQFVYYNPFNGRDNISPDVYVVFDASPPKWQTWVEGKFPDIVFEITSSSTQHNDLSDTPEGKRARYALLEAREYYVYDPQQEIDSPFIGYERRGDRLELLSTLASGGIYSPLLGTELRPMALGQSERRPAGVWLRVIDPATNQPIPLMDGEHRAVQATRDQLTETRDQLTETRDQLTETRDQLTEEARARLAAEERAAQVEAALQALLADLKHDGGATSDPRTA